MVDTITIAAVCFLCVNVVGYVLLLKRMQDLVNYKNSVDQLKETVLKLKDEHFSNARLMLDYRKEGIEEIKNIYLYIQMRTEREN